MTDDELITCTKNGITDAYGELIYRYSKVIMSVCLRIVDYHTAEDITQETFIDAYMKLPELRDSSKLSSWLCQIAKNKSYRYYKRSRKFEGEIPETYQAGFDSMPEEVYLERENRDIIYKQVNSLPPKTSETVIMHYYHNKSIHEIADNLHVPEGTVKRRLHDGREKLRRAIAMNDNTILNKIKEIEEYYKLYKSEEKFDNLIKETVSFVDSTTAKKEDYEKIYNAAVTAIENKDELKKKYARMTKNYNELSSIYINETIGRNDHENVITLYDNEIIPEFEAYKADNATGEIQFWKSQRLIHLGRYEEAYTTTEQAIRNLDKDNVYYANAFAVKTALDFIREDDGSYNKINQIDVCGEGFEYKGGVFKFKNQPGFGTNGFVHLRYDSIFYFINCCEDILFDENLKLGETITAEDTSTYTYEAVGETVETPAGKFENCSKYHMVSTPTDVITDVWFCENIGIVKVEIAGIKENIHECYTLSNYTVKAGMTTFMPLTVGNKWEYECDMIPDNSVCLLAREIIYINEATGRVNFSACYSEKLNNHIEYDSEAYIVIANQCNKNWDIDGTIQALKSAVQKNSDVKNAKYALYALDYHKRIKVYLDKKYRYMPGSVGLYNISKKDGDILFNDTPIHSIGPYRFGTRHEENRIFGIKIERWLSELSKGYLFDKKWVDGFKLVENNIEITVTQGGTIITKAGTFTDCLKVEFINEREGMDKDYAYGKKTYWFAPDVGVVKLDCEWGDTLSSVCELSEYNSVSTTGEYMPVYIGNRWVYDELTLESEGYRARHIATITDGIGSDFMYVMEQEFTYLGTEEEYEEFKRNL
jgi:RNA polymerase sigma factor, sigma-70 family